MLAVTHDVHVEPHDSTTAYLLTGYDFRLRPRLFTYHYQGEHGPGHMIDLIADNDVRKTLLLCIAQCEGDSHTFVFSAARKWDRPSTGPVFATR